MDFFLPGLLNDLIGEAENDAHAVIELLASTPEGGVVDASALLFDDAGLRRKVELDRMWRFSLLLETLTDKYDNVLRTEALLRDVAAGRSGFVLFLRGFSMLQTFSEQASQSYEADPGEYDARFQLATAIAPIPVVTVRNPATSESLLNVMEGAEEARATTFTVDLDDDWQRAVEALVRSASYIVVRNARAGAGLEAELAMLRKYDRLENTFFSHPDSLSGDSGAAAAQPLDERAFARMQETRPQALPDDLELPLPPTCLWLQQDRRRRAGDNAFATFNFMNGMAERGQRMPRDLQVRLLFSATAASVGLERLDLLIMALSSYAHVLSQYTPDELPDSAALLQEYEAILNGIAYAIDTTDAEQVFDFRDLSRLHWLMHSAEQPDQLIRATTRAVANMTTRFRRSAPLEAQE